MSPNQDLTQCTFSPVQTTQELDSIIYQQGQWGIDLDHARNGCCEIDSFDDADDEDKRT